VALSLGVFTPDNIVRRACYAVVDDKQFEWVIMAGMHTTHVYRYTDSSTYMIRPKPHCRA
jgi:hypothetical protein